LGLEPATVITVMSTRLKTRPVQTPTQIHWLKKLFKRLYYADSIKRGLTPRQPAYLGKVVDSTE